MTTEAEVVRDLAVQASGARIIRGEDFREYLIIPEKASIRDISDEYGLKTAPPAYISGDVKLQTQDSLVQYVERFKRPETIFFADISMSVIVGQIDYHNSAATNFVAHRATLTLPLSEEWRLWTSISGKLMSQLDFARFIEENGADIRAPDAADLLEAVRDLQAHRKVNFIKAVRTSSDNENFEFSDETTARTVGGVELPTKFLLVLPVYFGEPATELHAFLRWKLDDGALHLGVALHRVEHVRQAVFKQIVTAVSERTGCPAVFGKL